MNDYELVQRKMCAYEELYETHPTQALIFMIDLFPLASKSFNYEVFDAIDIWVQNCINKDIVDYLERKVLLEDEYKKYYLIWINSYIDPLNG
nr:hypothetical protein [uncultured Capnocytophaga sp.]